MKTILLCGITLLTVAPAFAQTSAPATAARANTAVTMTGCVGTTADASGFTLSNAMVIPGTAQPGQIDQTPSPLPPTVTSPPAQPPAATPIVPATAAAAPPASAAAAPTQVPPPASTAQVPPPASAAQVPAPASRAQAAPAATPATVGTAGTAPASVTGTTGVVAGSATPNTTSALGGYRLSGADMKSWAGQRVQVIGTFGPSAATAAGISGAPAAPPIEFRVQSVQPTSGPCPK
jgi:hypothetical protein